jgi:hypothetical protein
MANVLAVRPSKLETEKSAQAGTLMFRRADVLGMVRKLLHYADNNIAMAVEEGRENDAEVQRARRRTIVTLREGLKCLPMFENPGPAAAIPYDEAEAVIRQRSNGCPALAAATGTARTPQAVECEASQSGGSESERNAQNRSED